MFAQNETLSFQNEPLSSTCVKYLDENKIIVAGNSNLGTLELIYDEIDGCKSFRSSIKFPTSTVKDIEICGLTSASKTVIAVCNTEIKTNMGFISLVDVDTHNIGTLSMKADDVIGANYLRPFYNSLSSFQTEIAISTELGDIVVWDLASGKQLLDFQGDSCGVTKIKYMRSGLHCFIYLRTFEPIVTPL